MKYIKRFKKTKIDFEDYMYKIYPNDIHLRNAMIKAHDFIENMDSVSEYSETFTNYMWRIYPNDQDYDCRVAMNMAYNFISGKFHYEELEREKIRKMISDKTSKISKR